ncbi:reverse transcriptase domain, reverse transcriptase zinc-binding domain protein [Tanacetum coccineum]
MEKSLRQGDPLSPFLFLLVADALQISIVETCNKGIYKGVSLAERGDNLSLLQYADDALFFEKWSRSNATIHVLKCFEMASGLKINLSKSRIFGVRVDIQEVECNTPKIGSQRNSFRERYFMSTFTQALSEQPLKVSFEKKSCIVYTPMHIK